MQSVYPDKYVKCVGEFISLSNKQNLTQYQTAFFKEKIDLTKL